MSEWNTIYDTSEKVVGVFRHGVAWRKEPEERLGEYSDEAIYSNSAEKIASIVGNEVQDTLGKVLGKVKDNELYVNENLVGKFTGSKNAGAAAIVFLFSKCV